MTTPEPEGGEMLLTDEKPEYGLEEAFYELEDAAVDMGGLATKGRVRRIYRNVLLYLSVQDCYCGEPPSIVKPEAGGCAPCQARERLSDEEPTDDPT